MNFWLYFIVILILGARIIKQQEDDDENIYPDIDFLLYELDNVLDDNLKSISEELLHKCQIALALWSIDGREDTDYPSSTPIDHANADRLINKFKQTYFDIGGDPFNREGFVRDVFTLKYQWIISAVQYYRFINYYDTEWNPVNMSKLFEWNVYPIDFIDGFAPMYHLERSYTDEFGYTYMLGRKIQLTYHESLVNFGDYCPSYMELKTLIIGDITGEASILPLIASGYLEE
ncbi:unnamed protein product [Rotaria sordida]|uniref:Uncharacterized protein n=2 Tax=Rotaria sordida TaxID=392033 RepID=A0A814Y1D7_9BILA|nr:unnamed protein product [Rotaria sordida]CAF1435690.1 unnamed protein product [Rotaria sordida]CAF1504369.1 unnamed protein product [Rotaria sordida]